MPETVYPYGWPAPQGNEPRADFPSIYYGNLSDIAQKVIGSFDTKTSALAALGVSSTTPLWFSTTNPTTLWCLDSSGAHEVWTLGSGYTVGSFTMQGSDGNTFSLGSSTRTLRYRVEGSHCYGYGTLVVGSSVAWPSGKFLWFPIPYAASNAVVGLTMNVGSANITCNGNNLIGSCYAPANGTHISIRAMDPVKSTTSAQVLSQSSGNAGSSTAWTSGDVIMYNFDYERKI